MWIPIRVLVCAGALSLLPCEAYTITTTCNPPSACGAGKLSLDYSGTDAVDFTLQTSLYTSDSSTAVAELDSNVELTFSGGSGPGFYVPCFSVAYGTNPYAIGDVDIWWDKQWINLDYFAVTCRSITDVQVPTYPFQFDVPETHNFHARISLVPSAAILVNLAGFDVYGPGSGAGLPPIPSATWVASEATTPEPQLYIPLSIGLIAIGWRSGIRRSGRR